MSGGSISPRPEPKLNFEAWILSKLVYFCETFWLWQSWILIETIPSYLQSSSIPMDPLVITDYSAKRKNRKQSLFEVKQLAVVISSNEINSWMRDSEVTKLCPNPPADPGSGTPSVGARQTQGHRQDSGDDIHKWKQIKGTQKQN